MTFIFFFLLPKFYDSYEFRNCFLWVITAQLQSSPFYFDSHLIVSSFNNNLKYLKLLLTKLVLEIIKEEVKCVFVCFITIRYTEYVAHYFKLLT